MERELLTKIAQQWIEMTHAVLKLKRIPSPEVQELLTETYKALYHYHKDSLVPKEISEMLLEMDGFLYFASMITNKEFDDNPYLYQAVHSVAEALKEGFFAGNYECEFPLLKAYDANDKLRALDLKNGYLEDLI